MNSLLAFLMIVFGGVLPLIGLGRVAVRARRDLPREDERVASDYIREGEESGLFDIEPMKRAAQMTDRAPLLAWTQVRWDLGLIGGGIVLGTAGSAWSVFL